MSLHPNVVSAVPEMLDLHQVPPMETVSSSDGFDNLESDDESTAAGVSEESTSALGTGIPVTKLEDVPHRAPPVTSQQLNTDASRSTRRTRGMSFLPVRQSTDGPPPNLTPPTTSSSPPATPSPLRPITYPHSSSSRRSSDSNGYSGQSRSHLGTPTVNTDTSESLLAAYMNQLAAKEARVVDLRNTISRLQQEMKDTEMDLSAYKDNGKKLAELVNLPEGGTLAALKSTDVSGETQKDVLGMGRRVVDEIGTQFWSFLEDVKSATMGSNDFPTQGPSTKAPGGQVGQIPEPIPRSPSPHRQISPKRSIQDFLKNRPRSPLRRVRSPANSPERQRVAEQHASQRLRESDRLSKKLSQLDLRAPSPVRAQQDSHYEVSEL